MAFNSSTEASSLFSQSTGMFTTSGGTQSIFGNFSSSGRPESQVFNNAETSSSQQPFASLFSQQNQLFKSSSLASDTGSVKILFGKPVAVDISEVTTENSCSVDQSTSDAKSNLAGDQEVVNARKTAGLFGQAMRSIGKSYPAAIGSETAAVELGTSELHSASTEGLPGCSNEGENLQSSPESIKRKSLRRSVSIENTVLIVKCLPETLCKTVTLKKLFSKYGEVTKVFINARKASANIHFGTHDAALKAKRNVPKLKDCQSLQIFWKAIQASEVELRGGGSTSPRATSNRREVSRSDATEVEEELASMRGTADAENPIILRRDRKKPSTSAVGRNDTKESYVMRKQVETEASPIKAPPAALGKLTLTNTVGHSAGERYAILEERDKILRNVRKNSRPSNLATAQVILGTCPDMCPEKERYMREDRRRLSVYEMVPGTDLPGKNPQVDHSRAVKEYSRSSADQDMPLPTELRPPEVLNMTMNYLLNNIMNEGGTGKWGDWFDFLWNRTRGIRKDITQQQLCDRVAVSLVEKCARFHVYCSEALCEEDVTIFEPKINNENLTKCLQTLKELYSDLRTKQNIFCPNEAEFRAYMVLMNLNEGDILREVQQLRAEVRESDEVKFAVKVYSALNSINYVKFFKLVRQATFLSSCILHRYFNQIRAYALQRIIRAYLPFHGSTYHLSEFTRQLAFENDMEAKEFCEHHGVTVTADLFIVYSRFVNPEVAFAPRRAWNLIHTKQETSLAEIINGGPVPPDVCHEPLSTFDANGRYIEGTNDAGFHSEVPSITAESLKSSGSVKTEGYPDVCAETAPVEPLPAASSTAAPPSNAALNAAINEIIKETARDIFFDVINEHCRAMSVAMVNSLRMAEPVLQNLMDDVISDELQQVAAENVMLEKELRARERALKAASCSRVSDTLNSEIIDETVTDMMQDVANSIFREMNDEASVANVVVNEVLHDVTTSLIHVVTREFYDKDIAERLNMLQSCCHTVELWRMRRVLNIWKNRLKDRRKLKHSMVTFPSVPSMQSWRHIFSRLIPDSHGISVSDWSLHVGHSAHATLHSPQYVIAARQQLLHDLMERKLTQLQRHEAAWSALEIGDVIADFLTLKSVSPNKIFWKLVLFEPLSGYNDNNQHFTRWLKAKLTKGTVPNKPLGSKVETCSLYSTVVSQHSVGICTLSVAGDVNAEDLKSGRHLMGTSAVIFVVSCDSTSSPKQWEAERQRLQSVLSAKLSVPPTPLSVLCFGISEDAPDIVANELSLEQLVASRTICDYRIYVMDSDVVYGESSQTLLKAIRWLWEQSVAQSSPLIKSQTLYDFVENGLTNHFISPALRIATERRKEGLGHLDPNTLILWYNDVVSWLADMATHPSLRDLSWPIPEFYLKNDEVTVNTSWNTDSQMESLRSVIMSLTLRDMDCTPDTNQWSAAVNDVWYYTTDLIDCHDYNSCVLWSKIKSMLKGIETEFQQILKHTMKVDHCGPTYTCMPWTDVIIACIDYQLSLIASNQQADESIDYVHYAPDLFEKYPPPTLNMPTVCADVKAETRLADSLIRVAVKRKQEIEDERSLKQRRDCSLLCPDDSRPASPGLDSVNDISCVPSHTEVTSKKVEQLRELLEKERNESRSFEEYLTNAIGNDGSPKTTRQNRPSSGRLYQNSSTSQSCISSKSSLSDRLDRLNAELRIEKDAERLLEMQLSNILSS